MYVDFKVSVWERMKIPPEEEERVKKLIQEKEISSQYDVEKACLNPSGIEYETLYDTEEYILPIENDGQSTVEVIEILPDGKYNVIYTNAQSEDG